MSDEETILNLFDSFWFKHGVFTPKPSPSPAKTTQLSLEQDQESAADKPKLNRVTTLMRKSYSDQFLSSKDCSPESDSPSPKSVLGPYLKTILSGKEVGSFEDSPPEDISGGKDDMKPRFSSKPERIRERRKKREKNNGSRSLSKLEFEELKGFMDLGFVFSDEDRDSRLVSIIPGLQRLGKNVQDSDREIGETSVSRPYLSEAWECLEEPKIEKDPMMDWRIPAFGNEMELKDHIKFWAHSVASTVR